MSIYRVIFFCPYLSNTTLDFAKMNIFLKLINSINWVRSGLGFIHQYQEGESFLHPQILSWINVEIKIL